MGLSLFPFSIYTHFPHACCSLSMTDKPVRGITGTRGVCHMVAAGQLCHGPVHLNGPSTRMASQTCLCRHIHFAVFARWLHGRTDTTNTSVQGQAIRASAL